MSACNDCWDEAFRRSQTIGGHQADIYESLVALPYNARPWCSFARSLLTNASPAAGPETGRRGGESSAVGAMGRASAAEPDAASPP